MKKIINLAKVTMIFTALLISCDDIFEEDISDETIQTIYPSQNDVIEGNAVHFQWNPIEGAEDYRIQVVDINRSDYILIDSLIGQTNFIYSLEPGDYRWRVRAENFAYESSYSFPVLFSMETSDNLSGQTLFLSTPKNNLYTNTKDNTYTWQALSAANTYTFELQKNSGSLETVLLLEEDIQNTSFAPDANLYDEDAEYRWRVKGVNETSETQFTSRGIFIDTQTPNIPSLDSPADESNSVTRTIMFNWDNGTDTGNVKSEITGTVEISSDENFSTVIATGEGGDSYQHTFDNPGIYFWRVIAADEAGNTSDYSEVWKITVN